MTAFLSALGSGISAKKILEFLMRKSPDLKSKIIPALASGISAEKIVSFFSKDQNFEKLKSSLEDQYPMENNANPLVQAQNVRSQNLGTDMASGLQRQAPGIIGGAAALGTGMALQHALPNLLKGSIPEKIQRNQQTLPQQPPVNQVAPSVPDNIARMQAEEKIMQSAQEAERQQSLSKFNEKKSFVEREKERFEKGYGGMNAEEAQKLGKELTGVESKGEELDVSKEKAEGKDLVLSPQGLGEIVASRNGKSLVEIDGKKHQVEEKKLLRPPKEAAIEALELIKSFTPEKMRSTHHMLNAHDEEEKKGFFVFHNGSAYIVDDISPEEYKELSEEIEQAKTDGETIIGKWAAGEGSRGAGYNKIVKGVRERKVVPELKKAYRKLKVGYNLLSEWQRLLNEKD